MGALTLRAVYPPNRRGPKMGCLGHTTETQTSKKEDNTMSILYRRIGNWIKQRARALRCVRACVRYNCQLGHLR